VPQIQEAEAGEIAHRKGETTRRSFGPNAAKVLRSSTGAVWRSRPQHLRSVRPERRPGRLALSWRDFARFGLLYLRHGKWRDKQLLDSERVEMAISSPFLPTGR